MGLARHSEADFIILERGHWGTEDYTADPGPQSREVAGLAVGSSESGVDRKERKQ